MPSFTVAATPYPFHFALETSALIIIDMQRDFVEPGGFGESLGNDVAQLAAIVPTVQRVLRAWRDLGGWVIHTREAHASDLSDCPSAKRLRGNPSLRIGDPGPMGRILVAGEPGNQIVPELMPVGDEWVIDKPGKGAFYATGLDAKLRERGIQQLIFAGVTTEVCVQTSMREANDRGFDCLLLEDASASYFPEFHRATLEMITAQGGIVGWTTPSSLLLKGLVK